MLEPRIPGHSQAIWLIDRRDHWRQQTADALAAEGYDVTPGASYAYPPRAVRGQPRLVIVNGTRIGDDERRLIERILRRGHPLLVVASRLPTEQMRQLFRAGALDVVEMPPDRERMVALVGQAIQHAAPVSAYETVARSIS